jgi:hypothetical protein
LMIDAQPQTKVRQVMTRRVEAAHLHESVDTALDRMIERAVSATSWSA